ncbi:MAG: PstS family phosphate ABC transporter substrate-binding protein [Bacteroidia bacterium]
MKKLVLYLIGLTFFSCGDYYRDDYKDNSPTSGQLKVFCEEGLILHVGNQALTFESQYPRANIQVVGSNDMEAIQALYQDSCSGIIISREMSEDELKMFKSKNVTPRFSSIAYSGIALITSSASVIDSISLTQLRTNLTSNDSNQTAIRFILPGNQSGITMFVKDSVCGNQSFSSNVNSLNAELEVLKYVAEHQNVIGIVDYALIADRDDPIFKSYENAFKFIKVSRTSEKAEEPNPSTFKLGTYPLTRKLIYYRNSQEFSLSKGFEAFLAGPKGQLLFLKQGLLPFKQQERNIEVKFEPMEVE